MKINLENLSDEQFEHILNLLIVYKQSNRDKVCLNEKCIKRSYTIYEYCWKTNGWSNRNKFNISYYCI